MNNFLDRVCEFNFSSVYGYFPIYYSMFPIKLNHFELGGKRNFPLTRIWLLFPLVTLTTPHFINVWTIIFVFLKTVLWQSLFRLHKLKWYIVTKKWRVLIPFKLVLNCFSFLRAQNRRRIILQSSTWSGFSNNY